MHSAALPLHSPLVLQNRMGVDWPVKVPVDAFTMRDGPQLDPLELWRLEWLAILPASTRGGTQLRRFRQALSTLAVLQLAGTSSSSKARPFVDQVA
jgi:hypothetical protein